MDHFQNFDVNSWKKITSYEKKNFHCINGVGLAILKAVKTFFRLVRFSEISAEKGRKILFPFFSKTTNVDHFDSFINKNVKILKIAINSNYTRLQIVVACKISLTLIDWVKSYDHLNLCSDFGPEKFLCTENFRKNFLMSGFDPLPVRIWTLSRLHSGGRLLP